MADITQTFSGLARWGVWGAVGIAIGIVVITLIFLMIFLMVQRKRWSLKVEFKMPRSGGQIAIPEWGKGRYDSVNGVIWLKRKRKKAEPVKVKRLDKYLQGNNTVTAVGNPGSWKLVIPDTFIELTDDETGETGAFIKLRTDTKEDKSWATNFERLAKHTFTIQSWMEQYGQFIGWGFILLVIIIGQFVGFSMVLGKLKG